MITIDALKEFLIELKFGYYITSAKLVYFYIKHDYCYELIIINKLFVLTKSHVGYNYKYTVNDTSRLHITYNVLHTRDIDKMFKELFKLFKKEIRLIKLKKVLV